MTKNIIVNSLIVAFLIFTSAYSFSQKTNNSSIKLNTVNVPGTSILMSIPTVFEYNDVQKAYVYKGASASITATELKTSLKSVTSKIDAKYFEKAGFKYIEQFNIKTNAGIEGIIYVSNAVLKGNTEKKEVEFQKLMLLAGNETKSVWITINYPTFAKEMLYETMISSLKSVEF